MKKLLLFLGILVGIKLGKSLTEVVVDAAAEAKTDRKIRHLYRVADAARIGGGDLEEIL